mmetsp:Transcript_16824/g.47883  ORF Transcript_16824/g.47883 Transcript_16824/m.47883 type:complete len:125 (+) Transcript_16824:242-616(+)
MIVCARQGAFSTGAPRAHGGGSPAVLKYYPPPSGDHVDVIEHGSEVLVVRREPPLPSRGSLLPAVLEEEVTESTIIQDDNALDDSRSSPTHSGTEADDDTACDSSTTNTSPCPEDLKMVDEFTV